MTYLDLLNVVGVLLSLDGWLLAGYMFLAALIATAMSIKVITARLFFLWFAGLLLANLASGYTDLVIQARLPYVFIFCLGVVGLGFAIALFVAICFSPSIFAFATRLPSRRWLVAANVAMVFPFGPVILFFFVLREYKSLFATKSGAPVGPGATLSEPTAAPVGPSATPSEPPAAPVGAGATLSEPTAALFTGGEMPAVEQLPEPVSEDTEPASDSKDSVTDNSTEPATDKPIESAQAETEPANETDKS